MEIQEPTCTLLDRERLLLEYVGGTISDGDADRFETHCMTCDECSGELERGVEIRSVASKMPVARGVDWRWLAAAASVVLVVSMWQLMERSSRAGEDLATAPAGTDTPAPSSISAQTPTPRTTVPPVAPTVRPTPSNPSRGATDKTLRDGASTGLRPVAVREASGAVRIEWPAVENATRYVVTVFSATGSQLLRLESPKPSVSLDAATAAFSGHADERVFARIEAIDAVGVTLATRDRLTIPPRREEFRP